MTTQLNTINYYDNAFQSPDHIEVNLIGGENVTLVGMIGKIRKLGGVAFVSLHLYRDRIQCVFEGASLELANELGTGDFIKVSGTVVVNEKAYKGKEILVTGAERLGFPVDIASFWFDKPLKDRLDTILDNRLVTLRNIYQRAVFKLQEGVGRGFREFFTQKGFTEIHSPKLVKGGAEGGANIFQLEYFGQTAFLAQSPQFYKQFMVPVFGRVFEIGPVFRAEEHATARHINEYTGLDIEMGFIHSFRDIMAMETGYIQYMVNLLATQYTTEIELLNVKLPDVSQGIPEITFVEAKQILSDLKIPSKGANDLSPEEEREICEYIKKQTGSEFVFVTYYPASKRPFYTKACKDAPEYTESFDLLFRGIEITSGSQRINDYYEQIEGFRKKGLDPNAFTDFLELHKNGTPPHGGFGIGMERLLLKLIDGENIRETVLFPRDLHRLTP